MVTKADIRIFGRLSLLLVLPAIGILISSCSNNSSPTTGNNPTPTNTTAPGFTATFTATLTSTGTSTLTPTHTDTSTFTSTPTASPTQTATSTITSTPTVTLSPTVTSSPTATATTCNGILGNQSTAQGGDSTADGIVFFFRYQASINTTLIQLTANILYYNTSGDSSIQYGIYSDAAGPAPGSLLGSTSVFNANDMGGIYAAAVTLALTSPVAVTAGTYYWLAFDGGSQALYDDYPDASSSYFEWSNGIPTFVSLPANVTSSGTTLTMTSQPLFDLWGSTCP